jgi:hypothetical protein
VSVLATFVRYADEGEDMLNMIVTENESWVHHYQFESKRTSVKWNHTILPSSEKFNFKPSVGKVMLTLFWDSQGVLSCHFQNRGENMNAALSCEVLLKLQDAIRRKRSGQPARRVLLHHDNSRPHTGRTTEERIQ